jgi:hypothetical protein
MYNKWLSIILSNNIYENTIINKKYKHNAKTLYVVSHDYCFADIFAIKKFINKYTDLQKLHVFAKKKNKFFNGSSVNWKWLYPG